MPKNIPVVPNPTQKQDAETTTLEQDQKKVRVLKKQKKQIEDFENEANEAIKRIEKKSIENIQVHLRLKTRYGGRST